MVLVTAMSLAPYLLSLKASVIWLAVLFAVLTFHCSHLIFMRGEHRLYHASHIVMLFGMLYMYASVAFGWHWFPKPVWLFVYAATSAAIISWMWAQFEQRRPLSYLWVLALAQQGAMIYMWMPMTDWVPWLSYSLAGYFALEMMGWLTLAPNKPIPGSAATGCAGALVMTLEPRSAVGNICMSIMAASTAYMFIGMQLMMSPMPKPSSLFAQEHQSAPSQEEMTLSRNEPKTLCSTQAPEAAVKGIAPLPAETPPPTLADHYTVVAGDTLMGIASRLYGNARQWHRIEKANPGLNPRQLQIGQVLKLP
ncbi:MAG TPA: LysM domain-containing protein [Methylocella sp.]|nr:LysM domain-containing protein [Methylocella sp.]